MFWFVLEIDLTAVVRLFFNKDRLVQFCLCRHSLKTLGFLTNI